MKIINYTKRYDDDALQAVHKTLESLDFPKVDWKADFAREFEFLETRELGHSVSGNTLSTVGNHHCAAIMTDTKAIWYYAEKGVATPAWIDQISDAIGYKVVRI